jgi:O-antigen ligase
MKADRTKALTWALGIYGVLTLGSMATMSVGAALVGLALLFFLGDSKGLWQEVTKARANPAYEKYAMVSLALLICLALSLIVASLFPLAYGGRSSEVHFLTDLSKAWYLLWPLFLAPALIAAGPQGRKNILRAWLIAFGALSVLGILQYFTGFPRMREIPGTNRFHAEIFFGHHLSAASILIFPFFAALDLSTRKDALTRTGLSRRTLAVIAALGAVCLFFSFSRMLWVALPIGCFVWICWALPPEKRGTVLAASTLGLILVFLLPPVSRRILDMRGILTRGELWTTNLEFFKERPLTGVGWHHNGELSGYYLMNKHQVEHVFSGHAHNNLLDVMGGTGLLGTLAWLAWCVISILILLPIAKKGEGFARGLVCAWLVFQLNGLTQVNFWEAKVLHQISWVVAWSLAWSLLQKGKAWRES